MWISTSQIFHLVDWTSLTYIIFSKLLALQFLNEEIKNHKKTFFPVGYKGDAELINIIINIIIEFTIAHYLVINVVTV